MEFLSNFFFLFEILSFEEKEKKRKKNAVKQYESVCFTCTQYKSQWRPDTSCPAAAISTAAPSCHVNLQSRSISMCISYKHHSNVSFDGTNTYKIHMYIKWSGIARPCAHFSLFTGLQNSIAHTYTIHIHIHTHTHTQTHTCKYANETYTTRKKILKMEFTMRWKQCAW